MISFGHIAHCSEAELCYVNGDFMEGKGDAGSL